MRKFYPSKLEDFEKKYYEPAAKFPQFDRDSIAVFIEAFREYDLDGSGSIDEKELALAFKSMGQGVSKEKIQQIIKEVDSNGNGVIDWVEFLQIMDNLYSGRASSSSSAPSTSTAPTTSTAASSPKPSGFKAACTFLLINLRFYHNTGAGFFTLEKACSSIEIEFQLQNCISF
jgi:hypothetical protein